MTRSALVYPVICVFGALFAFSACDVDSSQHRCPLPYHAVVVDYDHSDQYLEQSPATAPEGSLKKAAAVLQQELRTKSAHLSIPELVNQVVHSHLKLERNSDLVLARDASEVWESGFASGCHDFADVAAAFLRSVGCPVVFVETVHDSYLRGESHHGHVFLEVALPGGDWMLYDPTNSRFWYDWTAGATDLPGGYHVMGRYRDPWQAGLGSSRDLLACMQQAKDNGRNAQ